MGTQVPPFDIPDNINSIMTEVSSNLYDAKMVWFTQQDIMNAIQDAYNNIFALLTPLEHSTLIPKLASPYYNLGQQIADFMYVEGIFNPATNLWLQGLTYQQFKSDFQTYLSIGEPRFINIVDFQRVILFPYTPNASGPLYLLYKASAPVITPDHIPILPYSTGSQLLQYWTTAQLMEQSREFFKAKKWWDKIYNLKVKGQIKSLWDQVSDEINSIARMDRVNVLEPYRWIFHGGTFNLATWINNETPAGTINGTNPTFTLAQVPNPSNSVMLFLNQGLQVQGTNYTLSGQTITMQSGSLPQTDDTLIVWYQIA